MDNTEIKRQIDEINNQINALYTKRMKLMFACQHDWGIIKTFYNGYPEAEYDFSLGANPSVTHSRKCKVCGTMSYE